MNKDDYNFFFGLLIAIPFGLVILLACFAGIGWFWENVVSPTWEKLA